MTFNQDSNMLCFAISYTALTAPEVAAHFHSPAAIGVAVGPTFGIPFGSPKTGCVGTLSDQQADDLEDGLFYINIHSTTFPAGEIRGQVLPVGGD